MALSPLTSSDAGAAARDKINAAIQAASKVDGKADAGALASISSLIGGKANQSALDLVAGRLDGKADGTALQSLADLVAGRRVDPTRSQSRPGDNPLAFTLVADPSALGGDNADLPDLPRNIIGFGGDGPTARLSAPGVVGMRRPASIETGRVYRLYAAVRRLANVADPSNDTVRIALQPLGQTLLPIGGAIVVVDLTTLVVADGRRVSTAGLGRAAGPNVDIVLPAGTVYVRAYVQSYGATGVTSVEVLDIEDVTAATLLPPVSSDLTGRVGSLESLGLGGRVSNLESMVANPLGRTFASVSDAAASHINAALQTVTVYGKGSAGDGRVHWFRRVATAPAIGLTFTDQDGQLWAETDQTVDPLLGLSSSVQGTGIPGIDGQSFFVYRNVNSPSGPETIGRFQLNATYAGGQPGTTRKALWVYATVGKDCADFVWPLTVELINNASAGENSASYFKAIKNGTGATFANVNEAIDLTAQQDPTTGLVAGENDVVATGTDANFNRIGLHLVARRPVGSSGAACHVGFGIKIDASTDTSARFKRAIALLGDIEVGFDLTAANVLDSAIKLRASQKVSFEETGRRTMEYRSGIGLLYAIDGKYLFRVDDTGAIFSSGIYLEQTGTRLLSYTPGIGATYLVNNVAAVTFRDDGDLAVNGGLRFGPSANVEFTGAFQTGTTPVVLGSNKPGATGGAPATWLSTTINGSQYWLPVWQG